VPIGSRDLRSALEVVHRLNADDTPASETAALALLGRLIGCDQVSVITSDPVARTMSRAVSTRPERNLFHQPGFTAALVEHPAFTAYRTGRLTVGSSVALSDLATPTALRALRLYVDFYRPQGTVDQLVGLAAVNGRRGLAVAVNRSRPGFGRRDRELLDLLTPHLAQAAARRRRVAALAATGRTPTRPAGEPPAPLSRLTERERQVALRLAEGATDREIARGLGIAVRTVHKHVEHTYRKLELTNRTSLAALVHRAAAAEPRR
jgi:DNA-binding NarL/FixJ family response regulator